MDRFSWTDGFLIGDECLVTHQSGVRLYDGEDKVQKLGPASLPTPSAVVIVAIQCSKHTLFRSHILSTQCF